MSTLEDFSEEEMAEYLDYLDSLRESGVVNMFGAASWLQDEFFLTKESSHKVLVYWMKNFGKRR